MLSSEQARLIASKLDEELDSVEREARGANSVIYRLDLQDGSIAVKIPHTHDDIEHEYDILQEVRGFGPEPILLDTSQEILDRSYLVMEYLAGDTPSELDIELAAITGRWYRELHDATAEGSKDRKAWLRTIRSEEILEPYREHRHLLPSDLRNSWKTILSASESLPLPAGTSRSVLTQTDPNLDNIFRHEDDLRFVDWEASRRSIEQWGPAFFLNYAEFRHGTGDTLRTAFLHAYDYHGALSPTLRLIAYLTNTVWLVKRMAYVEDIEQDVFASSQDEILRMLREDIETAQYLLHRAQSGRET